MKRSFMVLMSLEKKPIGTLPPELELWFPTGIAARSSMCVGALRCAVWSAIRGRAWKLSVRPRFDCQTAKRDCPVWGGRPGALAFSAPGSAVALRAMAGAFACRGGGLPAVAPKERRRG